MSRVRIPSPAPVRPIVGGSTPTMRGRPEQLLRKNTLPAQAVVAGAEVAKAIGLALQDFYFAMEAFSDAVIFAEAPHGGDFAGRPPQAGWQLLSKQRCRTVWA